MMLMMMMGGNQACDGANKRFTYFACGGLTYKQICRSLMAKQLIYDPN